MSAAVAVFAAAGSHSACVPHGSSTCTLCFWAGLWCWPHVSCVFFSLPNFPQLARRNYTSLKELQC